MENTLVNKANFFAQYLKQKVYNNGNYSARALDPVHLMSASLELKNGWLELKPLSSITDEDAIEVASLILKRKVKPLDIIRWDWRISIVTNREKSDRYEDCEIEMFISFDIQDNEIKFTWDYNHKRGSAVSERHCPNSLLAYDYLRSKGYALPWNDVSVEQQIQYGWTILKED